MRIKNDLSVRKIKFNLSKTVMTIFLVSFLSILTIIPVAAKTNSASDIRVKEYLTAANKSKDTKEKLKNYISAAGAIDKKNLTDKNCLILANIYYQIGRTACKLDDPFTSTKALSMCYSCLKYKNLDKNNQIAFQALFFRGMIFDNYGDDKLSSECFNEILNSQESFKSTNPQVFSQVYYSLASTISKDGDLNKAYDYIQSAIVLSYFPNTRSNEVDLNTLSKIKAGEILLKKEELDSALGYFNEVESSSKNIEKLPIYSAILYSDIGTIYFVKNEDKKATAYYEKSLLEFEKAKINYSPTNNQDKGKIYLSIPQLADSTENLKLLYKANKKENAEIMTLINQFNDGQYLLVKDSTNYPNISNILTKFDYGNVPNSLKNKITNKRDQLRKLG